MTVVVGVAVEGRAPDLGAGSGGRSKGPTVGGVAASPNSGDEGLPGWSASGGFSWVGSGAVGVVRGAR